MDKRVIFILIFLLMIPSACAWSIFGGSGDENNLIYIGDVETEWEEFTEDSYIYWVDFHIFNISSPYNLQYVITFYDEGGNIVHDTLYDTDNASGNVKKASKFYVVDSIWTENYTEISHLKIDVLDTKNNKLLFTTNESFNMSNQDMGDWDDDSDEDYSYDSNSKTDYDYDFFKKTDFDDDELISFDEFTEISYIFTEDSFWDGYSTEEIIQNEWDRANSDGDSYLTFEEFKKVI